MTHPFRHLLAGLALASLTLAASAQSVVINEIHYHPADDPCRSDKAP